MLQLLPLHADPRAALCRLTDFEPVLGQKQGCLCVCVFVWLLISECTDLRLYQRDKSITSGALEGRTQTQHTEYRETILSISVYLLCVCLCGTNACVFVFIDGLNENKVRGERLFSGD